MIHIINIRTYNPYDGEVLIRVDRTSPLGNPFYMHNESERDLVCDKYRIWLEKNKNVKEVREALEYIKNKALTNDVALACWCYPKRCHAESIIDILNLRSYMPIW